MGQGPVGKAASWLLRAAWPRGVWRNLERMPRSEPGPVLHVYLSRSGTSVCDTNLVLIMTRCGVG